MLPFAPNKSATTNAAFDNSGTIQATITGVGGVLRILNVGTVTAFVDIDTAGTGTASVKTGMPVLGATTMNPEIVSVPTTGTLYARGITASGTATVYFTRGS